MQVREYTGETLLHAAARSGDESAPQLIKLLVQSGASSVDSDFDCLIDPKFGSVASV